MLLFEEYDRKMSEGNYYMNEVIEVKKLPGCKQIFNSKSNLIVEETKDKRKI